MIKIVYFSRTNNIQKFIDKTKISAIKGKKDIVINSSFILLTYTDKFGEVPEEVNEFLKNNHKKLKGVIGSGNKNWGINYCKAVDLISEKYNVPKLQTFELSGNIHDVKKFKEIIKLKEEDE